MTPRQLQAIERRHKIGRQESWLKSARVASAVSKSMSTRGKSERYFMPEDLRFTR